MARYTATLTAVLRQRYEDTDQPIPSIAAEFLVCERNIQRLASDHNWKRRRDRKRAPRDVPVAVELLAQAQALAAHTGHSREGGNPASPEELGPRLRGDDNGVCGDAILKQTLSPIDRLEALVVTQIEAEEQGRNASHGPRVGDAERSARTLSTLTQTLHALQRLRAGKNPEHEYFNDDYDDMPRDIDEFRRDLARRINAFVASRTGGNDAC